MPPRLYSRHQFVLGVADTSNRILLTDRSPYAFRQFADNRQHIAKEGDSLFTLAARYFKGFPRPAGLWWVIADFQPDPIFDPTILLEPGRLIIIPSHRTVQDEIFHERRRDLS